MLTDGPGYDVVEVSIFGPGKGESVAVHLGEGHWIIVDSCVDQADRQIPVLDYLTRIGADPATDVRMVVGTHAHDDHIAGISTVFEQCSSAFFACSSAITSEEFFATVEADETIERLLRSRIRSEYRRVFELVQERGKSHPGSKNLKRIVEDLPLLSIDLDSGRTRAVVLGLSPSHVAVSRSIEALAQDIPAAGERRRLGSGDPNELAVALWVEVGEKVILLGADLLIGPAGCGWQAVLDGFHPERRASVFKVPHHGAPNAHHDQVWTDLVAASPVALLAPFRAGTTARPSPQDVARICGLTKLAYITASPEGVARSKAVRRTAATLASLAKNVRDPWGKSGHVRARSRFGDTQWSVEFSPPARPLCP